MKVLKYILYWCFLTEINCGCLSNCGNTKSPVSLTSPLTNTEWTYYVGSSVFYAPLRTNDGKLYFGTNRGELICLSGGNKLWSFNVFGTIFSTPVITSSGIVLFGSFDGGIYAINGNNGGKKWVYYTNGIIEGSPALSTDESIVYAGTSDGYLYAINISSGKLYWRYKAAIIVITPIVDKSNNIYFADKSNYATALHSNGTLIWTRSIYGFMEWNGFIDENGIFYVGTDNGHVRALYTSNGSTVWNIEIRQPLSNDMTYYNQTIYVGTQNGNVYVISTTSGTLLWSYSAQGAIGTTSAISSNGIYIFASDDNKIRALDNTGKLQWSLTLSSYLGTFYYSAYAVMIGRDSRLYFTSDDFNIRCNSVVSNTDNNNHMQSIWSTGALIGLIVGICCVCCSIVAVAYLIIRRNTAHPTTVPAIYDDPTVENAPVQTTGTYVQPPILNIAQATAVGTMTHPEGTTMYKQPIQGYAMGEIEATSLPQAKIYASSSFR